MFMVYFVKYGIYVCDSGNSGSVQYRHWYFLCFVENVFAFCLTHIIIIYHSARRVRRSKNMIPMMILEIRTKFPSSQIKVQAKFKCQISIRHVLKIQVVWNIKAISCSLAS